jgi:hypothetical protein
MTGAENIYKMEFKYCMKLQLNKESSIKSIQKEFSEHYPYLKVEFYKNHSIGPRLLRAQLLSASECSRKLDGTLNGNLININKSRTVAELEKDFERLLGFRVLVFRKTGKMWVETTLTDDWTLEDQNLEGEQLSRHYQ